MRGLICLVAALGMGIISGCGGSRNDPGMTDPPTPAPTDTISGVVTYKGAPLAGVTVTEWSTNTNAVLATTTTDANGNYSFSGIQTQGNVPLDLHIWATKTGYGFYPSLSGANFAAYDGTNPAVSVAATGQTASYASGDDGALQKGIAWSTARFTDNQDGTVTDHLTGLIWLKNASCITPSIWAAALTAANQLANGQCGLSDGSKAGQWRLPNVVEFESLIDVAASNPAIAPGSPFTNVANLNYWTSTSYFGGQEGSPLAWAIRMNDGRYI